jgi:hypothetical protein
MTTSPYTKLPGKARTLVTTSRLWLGDDHVLLVKSTRIVEEYRRFYFRDVQAIVIRRTMHFHYGWAAFLFFVSLLTARLSAEILGVFAVVTASGVFLWLRGPACVCHLYTAVQKEQLDSLHRLKTAERVVKILRAHIEERQGAIASMPDFAVQVSPPPLPVSRSEVRPAVPASTTPHIALFALLLISASLVALALFSPAAWVRVVSVASLVEFLFIVPLLAWQTGKALPHALKATTWAAVIRWMAVQTPAWIIHYRAAVFDKTTRDLSPWSSPIGQGWIGWLNLVSLIIVSAVGLYFAWRNSR